MLVPSWPLRTIYKMDRALASYQRSKSRLDNSRFLNQRLRDGLQEKKFISELTKEDQP